MADVILVVLVLLVGVSLILVVGKLSTVTRRQDLLEQRLRSIEAALGSQEPTGQIASRSEADGPHPRGALLSEEALAQRLSDRRDGDPAMSRIRALVRDGKKIEAIKLYRQTTGAGLKEAKDAVEGMQRQF